MPQKNKARTAIRTGGNPPHNRKPTDRLTGNSFTFIFYWSHIGTMLPTEATRFGRDGL